MKNNDVPNNFMVNNPINTELIHRKYAISRFIGNGKFGNVFKGQNIHTNEEIAIKTDILQNTPTIISRSTLKNGWSTIKHEVSILNYLYSKKTKNIPLIYWYGLYKDSPTLVMPYYEISLYEIFSKSVHPKTKYKYSSTLNMNSNTIMRSILSIMEGIHSTGVVHRDIKPHNFMLKNRELFLIDFGLASFYVDEHFAHIGEPDQSKEHLIGTRKYISYNIHLGKEYSRRDDLISCGYLYLFLQNQLFWDRTFVVCDNNIQSKVSDIYPETHILYPYNQCFKQAKELSNIEKCLTEGYTIPPDPVYPYLRYVYELLFNETPNYYMLRKHFE